MRHALAVLALSLAACQSGAALGTRCARDSECAAPLVCRIGGRCRSECASARDCPEGQVCLAPSGGAGACELPAVDVCALSCDPPLTCVSGHCRQDCSSGITPCPSGHVCSAGACQRADASDAGPSDAGTDTGRYVDAGWACDPFTMTGCGSDRCVLVDGQPTCQAFGSGAATIGQACTSDVDCTVRVSCQGGRCVQLCHDGSESTECSDDSVCSRDSVAGQSSPLAPGIGFCTEHCETFPQAGCPAPYTCAIGELGGPIGFTWCREVGAGAFRDTCDSPIDCAADLDCHDGHCVHFCDLATSACGAGGAGTCGLRLDLIAHDDVGVCTEP